MIKICLNCNKEFKTKHRIQKYCSYSCYNKFNYSDILLITYCCMDCGNLISRPTALKGGGRCRSCSRKGKLSWNLKYAKSGKDHHGWLGGWRENLPNCIDCGKKLSYNKCIRCQKCNAKFLDRKGNKNPMFGKKPKFYRFKYKNFLMRSSWEVLLAIWLDFSAIKWEYEIKTFKFKKWSYTPDFYLPEFDCWIEVKGWWKKDSKEKVLKLKKLVNLKVFTNQEFFKYLGVSRFLLEKSKETWLENYKIKQGEQMK